MNGQWRKLTLRRCSGGPFLGSLAWSNERRTACTTNSEHIGDFRTVQPRMNYEKLTGLILKDEFLLTDAFNICRIF